MANYQDFRVKRGIIVANTSTLTGNVAVGGTLTVNGAANLTGTTTITAPVTISNTTAFTGGNVSVGTSMLFVDTTNGRVAVNATSTTVAFYVVGSANVSQTFTAANVSATNISTTNLNANTLTVSGITNSVFGTSTLFINPSLTRVGINNTTPDASLTVTGSANVSGAVVIGGTSAHTGAATFSNTANVTGAVTLSSTLSVASDVTVVSGNVTLSNTSKFFVGSITGQSNTCARSVVAGSYLTGGGALTANVTINVDADSAATASKVVARDSAGNFSANAIGATTMTATTFSGSLSGTASQANTLYDSSLPTAAYRSVNVNASSSTIPIRNSNHSLYANIYYGTAQYANYADLAEMYLPDQEYEPGTVVVIGGEKEITASSWGQRAIGAISTNPGFLLNHELEGGLPVALKGRIPVRVSGSVRKGDRLVAGNDGTAVAGTLHSGDVFAIAMETNSDPLIKMVECVIL